MAVLAVVLAWAVRRPRGWPEAVAAVPAAGVVIAAGAVTWHGAVADARRLGPVVGFLACVLMLARLCDDDGLFRACGAWLARRSGGRAGSAGRRLLAGVFVIASVTTAVLSLDATVVLLTPVVLAAASRAGARARPQALLAIACLAAVLASVVNNLPAVLVLLPLAAPSGAGAVLAVLLGVNIGPNLTYTGSLATLLWRRELRERGCDVSLAEFTRLGMLTVIPSLALCVLALWAGLHIVGGLASA